MYFLWDLGRAVAYSLLFSDNLEYVSNVILEIFAANMFCQ